jgi:hypothetical protein
MLALLKMLTVRALAGDVGTARLLLARVVRPLRAAEQAQSLNWPEGTLTEQAQAVLTEVSADRLAPRQGAVLWGGIATLAHVIEVDELAARIKNWKHNMTTLKQRIATLEAAPPKEGQQAGTGALTPHL